MKFNRLISAAVALAACVAAWADGPFREHRYDSFKATPTVEGQIMFVGNSITNMHSWFEAFDSHQEVVGRGNSGGFAYEVLDNLESYIDNKPSKLFLMIGTNDVSSGISYQLTAKRIEAIARRVRLESPETEVYLQTILPRSSNAKPDYELCNALVKQFVEELNDPKVHHINLSEVCAPLNGNSTWSYDGLHPRPIGYAAWSRHIQDYVGYQSVYPATITSQVNCGLGGSSAARVEQFPYFPVSECDVLFFGDEQVHGGEWHELLRSPLIKDRGQLWGWGGMALDNARQVVANALNGQAGKPAKIFLFYGVGEKNADKYRLIVDEAKAQAPEAKIYVVSLTPSTNTATNDANVAFNTQLQTIAAEKGATYVDIYTPLNAELSSNIMYTNYVSGRGYVVMANELAKHLADEQVNPVSLDEYAEVYARRSARKIIGDAMTSAMLLEFGSKPGQVKESHRAAVDAALAAAATAVNDPALTAESARTAADALNNAVNTVVADLNYPADGDTWYVVTSQRGNRVLTEEGGTLFGRTVSPKQYSTGHNVWKFVDRGDNTYDIVNFYGQYVNPVATYNKPMTVTSERPARGFSLSNSNAGIGSFVIYTDNSQLNQTTSEPFSVFSWYGGSTPDRGDQGCAYNLTEFEGVVLDEASVPDVSGWYEIRRATDNLLINNLDSPVRQTAANSYSMQMVNADEATPRNWVYIEVSGSNRYVRTLNGFYVSSFTTNITTPTNIEMAYSGRADGAFNVRYWTDFTISNIQNVVGRSSAKNDPFLFKAVSSDKLSDYDVWTVSIEANPAAELMNNTYVTLSSAGLRSIAKVYDGGVYFLEAGSVINESDITVTAPEGVEQSQPEPSVIIDAANHNITVVFTEIERPATSTLAEGWYTLDLCGAVTTRSDLTEWVDNAIASGTTALHATATEYAQSLQSNVYYYFIGVSNPATLDAPALTCFYVTNPSLTALTLKSQSGHYSMANGTAGRTAVNLELSLTNKGTATLPICLWANNNIGAPHNLLGAFSGSKCNYALAPANLSAYDLYNVNIIGATAASAIRDDVQITLNSDANKGLESVYNGGTFFVAKGADIKVDNVEAPAHADNNNPLIEINDGVITVDYTRHADQDSISDVVSGSEQESVVYDLWGRRVASPRHGLYIVNGRKVRI